MEAGGEVRDRTQVKCRRGVCPRVSRRLSTKPNIRSGGRMYRQRSRMKFCVLTRGDLLASATAMPPAVVVENERTTWRRDKRSRMVA